MSVTFVYSKIFYAGLVVTLVVRRARRTKFLIKIDNSVRIHVHDFVARVNRNSECNKLGVQFLVIEPTIDCTVVTEESPQPDKAFGSDIALISFRADKKELLIFVALLKRAQ